MAEKKTPKLTAGTDAGSGAADGGGPMDPRLLEQLVKLMAANDLNTVDVRDGDRRVILKRGPAAAAPAGYPFPAAPPAGLLPAAPPMPAAAPLPASPAGDDESKYLRITSPMVGTFYVAPKQGEKPYVAVGTVVNEETDVCIIEAMKTFNVHKAGVSGTIAKIVVQDGHPVQFDQVLFLVKPA